MAGLLGLDKLDKPETLSAENCAAMEALPSVNKCGVNSQLKELHHKLVRYDCVITDMYEEEIYVSVLQPTRKPIKNEAKND